MRITTLSPQLRTLSSLGLLIICSHQTLPIYECVNSLCLYFPIKNNIFYWFTIRVNRSYVFYNKIFLLVLVSVVACL